MAKKQQQKRLNPKPFFFLGVALLVALGGFFILSPEPAVQHYDFAACLAESGITMYGFDACPSCNRQKSLIGKEAFKQEFDDAGHYVRCRPADVASQPLGERVSRLASVTPMTAETTQAEACAANVGTGTPTWVWQGEKYDEVLELERLAEMTGCPLPVEAEE